MPPCRKKRESDAFRRCIKYIKNPHMRQSQGEGSLFRHRSLEKAVLPREEENRSLRGGGKRAKSKGRQRRKREKQVEPDRAGARKIPSVISERNAISGRQPKDKHTHIHTQKNKRSESIVCTGLALEQDHNHGEPL